MNRPQREVRKRAFKEPEAAEYLAVSRSYLRQDRMNGTREGRTPGPRCIHIGRAVRYLKEDLDAWLDQFRRDTQATTLGGHRVPSKRQR